MSCRRRALPLLLLVAASAATAAGDDAVLDQYAATWRYRLGRPSGARATPDGAAVLYLRSGARDFVQDLYELDVHGGVERRLLAAERLLGGTPEALDSAERARRERRREARRGIVEFDLSRDGRRVLVPLDGRLFVLERASGEVRELTSEAGRAAAARLSPDGRRVACVRAGDLWVVEIEDGAERRLTHDAGPDVTNGLAEFIAEEEMDRHQGLWWSPDSRRLLFQRSDVSAVERLVVADPAHPERVVPPRPYPRAGGHNAEVRLGLIGVRGGETTWVTWDAARYEYVAAVRWPEDAPPTLLVQNRTQTEQALLRVDPATGMTTTLLVEHDPAWVEIEPRVPLWLGGRHAFLWVAQREGGRVLELRRADGGLDHVVLGPEIGLRAVEHVFPGDGGIVVSASPDPTRAELYGVSVAREGAAPRELTRGPWLSTVEGPGAGPLYVHVATDAGGTRRFELMGAQGPIGRALPAATESPLVAPNLEFTTVGRAPTLYAVLVRPRTFDPARRYPVLVHVYGGPTSQMVQRSPVRYVVDQWLADHGYVVVSIDGRGTPNRERAFTRAVKGDLISLPLEDQAHGLALLGERYPELDLDRVGIFGWSFGGYVATMALLRRPDVFHAGVAGAPVTDWADYDTHYTERYLGLPAGHAEAYAATSAVREAARLSRPLLIVHGTADDNVLLRHSLRLSAALFRAGAPFELLPLVDATHMASDPELTRRLYHRILRHFDEHVAARSVGQ